jgi:hypothetical protein
MIWWTFVIGLAFSSLITSLRINAKLGTRKFARERALSRAHDNLNTDDRYDLVVVGAGVGGLSTAAIVAKKGKRVLVLETNEQRVGAGRCGSFVLKSELDGASSTYRFDSGPSLLLLPDVYERAFAEASRSDIFQSLLDIVPVQGPRFHVYFDEGGAVRKGSNSGARETTTPTAAGAAAEPAASTDLPQPLVLQGGLSGFAQDCASFEELELKDGGREGGGAAYAAHMVTLVCL